MGMTRRDNGRGSIVVVQEDGEFEALLTKSDHLKLHKDTQQYLFPLFFLRTFVRRNVLGMGFWRHRMSQRAEQLRKT